MSKKLETQLKEDRALRNAGLALVKADIAQLKGDFSAKSIGGRMTDRMTQGAVDVFEEAVDAADDNRGALVTLIVAVAVWFARNPILDLFSDTTAQGDEIVEAIEDAEQA